MGKTFVEGRKLPTRIKGQYENCFDQFWRVQPALTNRQQQCLNVFIGATAILGLWYLANPFVSGVGIRYVSQTVALLLIALGIGYLGVLKELTDLPPKVDAAPPQIEPSEPWPRRRP